MSSRLFGPAAKSGLASTSAFTPAGATRRGPLCLSISSSSASEPLNATISCCRNGNGLLDQPLSRHGNGTASPNTGVGRRGPSDLRQIADPRLVLVTSGLTYPNEGLVAAPKADPAIFDLRAACWLGSLKSLWSNLRPLQAPSGLVRCIPDLLRLGDAEYRPQQKGRAQANGQPLPDLSGPSPADLTDIHQAGRPQHRPGMRRFE